MSPPSVALEVRDHLGGRLVDDRGPLPRRLVEARGEDHLVGVDEPLGEAHVARVGALHVDDGGPEAEEPLGVDPTHHARGRRLPEAGQVVTRDVGDGVRHHPAHVDRVVRRGVVAVEGEGDVGDDPAAAGLLCHFVLLVLVRSSVCSVWAAMAAASLSRLWPKPSSMPAMKSAESTVLSVIRTRTSRSVPLSVGRRREVDVGRERDAAVGQRGGGAGRRGARPAVRRRRLPRRARRPRRSRRRPRRRGTPGRSAHPVAPRRRARRRGGRPASTSRRAGTAR